MRGTAEELRQGLGHRQKAYQATFKKGAPAYEAFVDLARFCHAFHNEIVPHQPELTERLAGRREAFMHIWQFMNLDPEILIGLYPQIILGETA